MDEEGLLSQDDINAALAEAGLEFSTPGEAAEPFVPEPAVPPSATVDERVDSAGRPYDEVAAAMAEAIENEKASALEASAAVGPSLPIGAMPFDIPELQNPAAGNTLADGIDFLRDVELDVKIELGRSRMLVDDVLRLGEGSVVELDKLAGDPVDVYVNDRLVAHGEVLVLNDNFCVRINDIVRQDDDEE